MTNAKAATAANTHTVQPCQTNNFLNNEIISRDLIANINVEGEKSDRLTVAKLGTINNANKWDNKSNLMTDKYSLLPVNPQQLTPLQTALQRLSVKHPDFEIQPVNTIRPPEIE